VLYLKEPLFDENLEPLKKDEYILRSEDQLIDQVSNIFDIKNLTFS